MNNSGLSIMYLEAKNKREKLAEYLKEDLNSILLSLNKGLPIYSGETADLNADIQRYTEFITEERLLKKLLDKMEEQNGKEKNA